MQSTQQQIVYGITAISCAYLLYSITKQKTSKNKKNKNQKQKHTPKYTFGTKKWFISYFNRSASTIDNKNLNHKTRLQRIELENKQSKQNNKNFKQESSKDVQIPQDLQPNNYNLNLNQITENEDQLFFKLGLRLLNSVKG
ncbi:unnamed protein product [Paramecium primaurelia]|uniref:Transmembrane protein n=1 Tax=Paramecium primaurelia TaxID=5886 RepID=A0A8S1MGH6_PARPR|nr:unnamed protein product [Paramecium primaurelia]